MLCILHCGRTEVLRTLSGMFNIKHTSEECPAFFTVGGQRCSAPCPPREYKNKHSKMRAFYSVCSCIHGVLNAKQVEILSNLNLQDSLLCVGKTILTIELLNTSLSGSLLLLASIEGMALGADLNVNLRLCRTCHEFIPTVAGNLCLIILRLNVFSHLFHLAKTYMHRISDPAFVF